jgi:hypothetical protein
MSTQSESALKTANAIRKARAVAKSELREGRITLREALDLDCFASMTIYKLLIAQKNVGDFRALAVLHRLQINPQRRVQGLTERQCNLIVETIR